MFNQLPILIPVVLAVVTLACLFAVRKHVSATTLTAAWWWSVISVVAVACTEVLAVWTENTGNQNDMATLRYVVAAITFCPMMAVLGAKRPQHNAWQLIVFSLWCVLVLPAAESYFVRRGGVVQIHDARGVFLWLLIVVGLINYLPTRFTITAICVAAAQVCFLANFLPVLRGSISDPPAIIGLLLVAIGALIGVFVRRTPQKLAADQPWLDFFNCFGAFWGLRVAERFNALALAQKHDVRLGWFGFESAEPSSNASQEDVPVEVAAESNLDSLLLRFVDADWIRRRRVRRGN